MACVRPARSGSWCCSGVRRHLSPEIRMKTLRVFCALRCTNRPSAQGAHRPRVSRFAAVTERGNLRIAINQPKRPRGKGTLRPAICVAQGAGNAESFSLRHSMRQVPPYYLSDTMSRAQRPLASQPLNPKRNPQNQSTTNSIALYAVNTRGKAPKS